MENLIINNKNALQEWGVRMGDDFVSNLLSPAGIKDFIENESGLEHGKQVLISSPFLSDRDVTLNFTITGSSPQDYLSKYTSFVSELQKGGMNIRIPEINECIYRLVYKQSTNFSMNTERTFSTIAVKFNEPNPNDRG